MDQVQQPTGRSPPAGWIASELCDRLRHVPLPQPWSTATPRLAQPSRATSPSTRSMTSSPSWSRSARGSDRSSPSPTGWWLSQAPSQGAEVHRPPPSIRVLSATSRALACRILRSESPLWLRYSFDAIAQHGASLTGMLLETRVEGALGLERNRGYRTFLRHSEPRHSAPREHPGGLDRIAHPVQAPSIPPQPRVDRRR